MKPHLVAGVILLCALVPATARAQAPTLLGSWNVPRPMGIAFDPAGNIYVAESANHHIEVHAPGGTLLAQRGSDGGDVWSVTGSGYLAVDVNDHLFIAEWTTHNVDQSGVPDFTTNRVFIGSIGTHTPGLTPDPAAFAVDSRGNVYVTGTYYHRVQVFANDGTSMAGTPEGS